MPVFQVDAGGLFNFRISDQQRSRAMMEGVSKLGVEIMNLIPADARELQQLGLAGKLKQPQFVSANVFGPGRKPIAPPYLVRRGAGGARIVFIGLSEVRGHETFGYTVEDAQETLKKLLPQVGQASDLVVVLAYMSNRDVVNIAANLSGIDVMVTAYEEQFAVAPYQIGQAWILQAQYEGRFVGEAGLQWSPGKQMERIAPHKIVGLDSSFADDPEMAALVARVKPAATAAAGDGKGH